MPRPKSSTPAYTFYRSHNKKIGRTYLYMARNEWNHEKKQSRIAERHHVGAIDEDGKVNLSPKFIAKFPQYAGASYFVDGKLIDVDTYTKNYASAQETLLNEVDRVVVNTDHEDFASGAVGNKVRNFGAVYALLALAAETGIYRSLKEVFGHAGNHLLAMAIFRILGEDSYLSYADWHLDNLVSFAEPLSSQRCSEIHAAVTEELCCEYWKNRAAKRKLERKEGIPDICALDATSISTYSSTITQAAYGHNKQDEHLRQINLTLVCDQNTGEVFYAKVRNGSIPDIVTLRDLVADMIALKITGKDVVLVMDRGYDSSINIEKMLSCDMHFVLGANDSDSGIKTMIKRYQKQLNDYAFNDPEYGLLMSSYHDKNWGEGSAVKGRQEFENGVYLHMFRDCVAAAEQMQNFDKAVKTLANRLNAQKDPKQIAKDEDRRLAKAALRFKSGSVENPKGKWVVNSSVYAQKQLYAGTFAIWSDVFAKPQDALNQYRKRNIVEQGFNVHKNMIGGKRLRCTEKTYNGRIFVHLLAQSLIMIIYHRVCELRKDRVPKSEIDKVTDLDGNSIPLLLTRLGHIKAKKIGGDSDAWLVDPLTRKQRDYFEEILKIKIPPRVV